MAPEASLDSAVRVSQALPAKNPCVPFVLLLLALVGPLAVFAVRPPDPAPVDAPAQEFSAERARAQLEWIAAEPHPTGTQANREVRERLGRELEALGFEVTYQCTPLGETSPRWRVSKLGDELCNVIARRRAGPRSTPRPPSSPGPRTTEQDPPARRPALLTLAHHDSVPDGPGAGDDGAAVAALLETARALADVPLEHDWLIVLTDGEELGLVGARLFLDEHPFAEDVLAVVNFEARGVAGPSTLFQVGENSGGLVKAFARAAPHPFGTSLAPAVYERMPNDTDFTLFLERDVPGLNFAFLGGGRAYHTPQDTVAELDLGSLQHHGEHMTALVRTLGRADLERLTTRSEAREFFPVGSRLVVYPRKWSLPLGLVAVFGLMILLGRATNAQRPDGTRPRQGYGLGALLLVLGVAVTTAAVTWGLPQACRAVFDTRDVGSNWRSGEALSVSSWVFALGLSLVLLRMRVFVSRADELATGAFAFWALLAVALPLEVPGAGHLGLFGLLGVAPAAFAVVRQRSVRGAGPLVQALLWLPAAVVLAPLLPLFVAVGSVDPVGEALLGTFAIVLILSSVLPLLVWLGERRLGVGATLMGLGALGLAFSPML